MNLAMKLNAEATTTSALKAHLGSLTAHRESFVLFIL